MATLNAEHINPFLMAAKKVLQDMCFVDVAIQKPILKEAKFDHDYWVIIIGVTGGNAWTGTDWNDRRNCMCDCF